MNTKHRTTSAMTVVADADLDMISGGDYGSCIAECMGTSTSNKKLEICETKCATSSNSSSSSH